MAQDSGASRNIVLMAAATIAVVSIATVAVIHRVTSAPVAAVAQAHAVASHKVTSSTVRGLSAVHHATVAHKQSAAHRAIVAHKPAAIHRSPAWHSSARRVVARRNHVAVHRKRAVHTRKRIVVPKPYVPLDVEQVGGSQPAMRVLEDGAWDNTTGFVVRLRLASAASGARLQPQIELRPGTQPFTGRATASGPVVTYRGTAVADEILVSGLRNNTQYHWRVRVRDLRGAASSWVGLSGSEVGRIVVFLNRPAAPRPLLLTPARPNGWLTTRRVTLSWSQPHDATGIRGYSYTLSRSATALPLLKWRTWSTQITIQARGDGIWYFSVRALNKAHTWGPAAQLTLRIDSGVPGVRLLALPSRPVNPAHLHTLARVQPLGDVTRLTASLALPDGAIAHSWTLRLPAPVASLALVWNGRLLDGHTAPNGRYVLTVAATNRAGVLRQASHAVYLMPAPPAVTAFGLSQSGTYNPYNNDQNGPEVITATLSAPARVRVEAMHDNRVIRAWSLVAQRAGAVVSATWDGWSARGGMLPGGLYTFRLIAWDAAGNASSAPLGWVVLDHRRIVVSLDAQRLWALDGDRVLLTTLVTTGGPELPTPTGDFQIIDRESPFTFHSPYPRSSRFWYPPSPVTFALLFQINGYFLHDAPWRSQFGPGSNVVDGIPGQNTTGTHGCVNVPYDQMAWLYQWATMGTPVQVRQSFNI